MARNRTGWLRIIGGTHRGRRLVTPAGRATRPPLDRQRETVFNLLGPAVADATVVDLFSGSGSFGLEALSRGASEVTFVENDAAALAALQANRAALGVEAASRVVRADAFRYAATARGGTGAAGVVFVDPPFEVLARPEGTVELKRLLDGLPALLAPEAVVVLRTPAEAPTLPAPPGCRTTRCRTLGKSRVCLYYFGDDPAGDEPPERRPTTDDVHHR